MTSESVVESPTIEVPAQFALDRFTGTNELSIMLSGAEGILSMLDDHFTDDTAQNRAINAVWRLVSSCLEKADSLQWSYADGARAERALGVEET